MPQPPSQRVQTVGTLVISPLSGDGRQDQFWLHMAASSVSFHGIGESRVPPTAPAANCKKALLPTLIPLTLSSSTVVYDWPALGKQSHDRSMRPSDRIVLSSKGHLLQSRRIARPGVKPKKQGPTCGRSRNYCLPPFAHGIFRTRPSSWFRSCNR